MKKVLSIIAVLAGMTAFANDIPETKETAEVPQSATMLEVAGQLVKYGYAENEALPLIQAADIYQSFSGKSLEAKPEKTGAVSEDTKTDNNVNFDVAKLLADATTIADGDATLLALIQNVRDNATRGAVKNYAVTTEKVAAGGTDTYKIKFRGGERACVIVSGDGDTDLDLYIYDSYGNLVCSDVDLTDDCVCIWTPRYTETFTIKIKNYGHVYNRYQIGIN